MKKAKKSKKVAAIKKHTVKAGRGIKSIQKTGVVFDSRFTNGNRPQRDETGIDQSPVESRLRPFTEEEAQLLQRRKRVPSSEDEAEGWGFED